MVQYGISQRYVIVINGSGLVDSRARVISFHRREDTAIKAMNKILRRAEREGMEIAGTTMLSPNDAGGYGRPGDAYLDVWEIDKAIEEEII